MSGGSLSDRLSRIRALKAIRVRERPDAGGDRGRSVPGEAVSPSVSPQGFEQDGWERTGDFCWKKSTLIPVTVPRSLDSLLLGATGLGPENLIFFDTETTGLSGGAGNYVFLVGIGRIESDGGESAPCALRVSQYFLADFPGERDFLGCLSEAFDPEGILVSFNGKTFDCGILTTRFLMNGMRFTFGRHLDLLYPSRMLWKTRLASCSLTTIEREVLLLERDGDIPGSLVPDMYFRFLKTGDAEGLRKVFYHNLTDVSSLLTLFLRMETLFLDPEPDVQADPLAMGKFLLKRNASSGERFVRLCWERGDAESGRMLGHHLRRTGRFAEAAAVWEKLYRVHGSIQAAVELAKLYEHRFGDPRSAHGVILDVLTRPKIFWASREEALLHRRARLERKTGLHRS